MPGLGLEGPVAQEEEERRKSSPFSIKLNGKKVGIITKDRQQSEYYTRLLEKKCKTLDTTRWSFRRSIVCLAFLMDVGKVLPPRLFYFIMITSNIYIGS